MKKLTLFFLASSIFLNISAFATDPVITWNRLNIPLAEGLFYKKSNNNELHVFIKDVKNSLLSISFGDIANKQDIMKRTGYKINNCTFEYIYEVNFFEMDAFEWQVSCSTSSNGTKTTLTIPDLDCEISLEGKRSEFVRFEKIIKSITISK